MSRNLLGPSHSISQFRKLNRFVYSISWRVLCSLYFVLCDLLRLLNRIQRTKHKVQSTRYKVRGLRQVEDPSVKVSENLSFLATLLKRKNRSLKLNSYLVVGLLLSCFVCVHAQTYRGTLRGTIYDPNGAV